MTRKSLVDYYYQEAGRKSITSSDWPFFRWFFYWFVRTFICSFIVIDNIIHFGFLFSIALKYEPAPKECNEAMSAARKRLKELDKSKRK